MLGAKPPEKKNTRRVLVAEDDPTGAKLIEMSLNKMGISNVTVVVDGMEAWKEIENATKPFSLIVADWNMPFVTGIELLERVRDDGIKTPFIIITGKNSVEAAVEAKEMGVTAFLPKPYTPNLLMRRIEEVLAQAN